MVKLRGVLFKSRADGVTARHVVSKSKYIVLIQSGHR